MKNPVLILTLVSILVASGLVNIGLLPSQQSFAYISPLRIEQLLHIVNNNCEDHCDGGGLQGGVQWLAMTGGVQVVGLQGGVQAVAMTVVYSGVQVVEIMVVGGHDGGGTGGWRYWCGRDKGGGHDGGVQVVAMMVVGQVGGHDGGVQVKVGKIMVVVGQGVEMMGGGGTGSGKRRVWCTGEWESTGGGGTGEWEIMVVVYRRVEIMVVGGQRAVGIMVAPGQGSGRDNGGGGTGSGRKRWWCTGSGDPDIIQDPSGISVGGNSPITDSCNNAGKRSNNTNSGGNIGTGNGPSGSGNRANGPNIRQDPVECISVGGNSPITGSCTNSAISNNTNSGGNIGTGNGSSGSGNRASGPNIRQAPVCMTVGGNSPITGSCVNGGTIMNINTGGNRPFE